MFYFKSLNSTCFEGLSRESRRRDTGQGIFKKLHLCACIQMKLVKMMLIIIAGGAFLLFLFLMATVSKMNPSAKFRLNSQRGSIIAEKEKEERTFRTGGVFYPNLPKYINF
jgi:hypothetical protein